MTIEYLDLKDAYIYHPYVFKDNRGWFFESYSEKKLPGSVVYVQDNHSYSKGKGVFRGLHIQLPPFTQSKLIRCTKGEIIDVIVDVRESSPTFLKHRMIHLSADNFNEVFVPKGFLHGFLTISDEVEVQYKVDALYNKASERSVRFDDKTLGIDLGWKGDLIMSEKDKNALTLDAFLKELKGANL